MKMFNKKLHELLQEEFGKRGIEQIEIPFLRKREFIKRIKNLSRKSSKVLLCKF